MQKVTKNSIKNVLGCIVISLLLISCTKPQLEPTVITKTKLISPTAPIVPEINPLNLSDVKWKIITSDTYKAVFDSSDQLVFFSLTPTDYEKLSLNTNDLRSHIQQQNAVILLYKKHFSK